MTRRKKPAPIGMVGAMSQDRRINVVQRKEAEPMEAEPMGANRMYAEASKAADQIISVIFRVSREAGKLATTELIVEAMKRNASASYAADEDAKAQAAANTKDRGQKLDPPPADFEDMTAVDEILPEPKQ